MSTTEETLLLWESFKQGDWNAYTQLYNLHFKLLTNYGYKFTKDISFIEDAVQDLFIKLWTNKENLGSPLSVRNYLYKALRSILFRKMQARSRFTEIQDKDPLPFEVSFDQVLIKTEEERELSIKIKSAVNALPARQQEIVFLRFYEGFSYLEIADIMEITIASTYKLLYKALNSIEFIFATSTPNNKPI
ncbi:RNA polymerase sigma factor [Hymenobacter sp. GOD-10R]|uniref:RNA polymerase sigma factor n=1 Tax=Hymenobacter sp. GOD-10R TaxID=3093922 RepID=UPI002D788744|nr:RNA polymerase sigma factor [Hymenobacter sp. GOD-10R]WRQ27337.1 RNA polymerase sigma factor [Hymenobacter sp. GOD-10R]